MQHTLTFHTRIDPPMVIFTLVGGMAATTMHEFHDACHRMIELKRRRYVVIDLTAVNFIDSSAVGDLVRISRICEKRDGKLAVVSPEDRGALDTVNRTQLGETIDFFPDFQSALRRMREELRSAEAAEIVPAGATSPTPSRPFTRSEPAAAPEPPRPSVDYFSAARDDDRLHELESRINLLEQRLERFSSILREHAVSR